MANYSLVINSKFKPFSFERYLQPYQIYGQAYREQEDALAELETKASIWDKMANEATDPKAHAIYKKYADDLQSYSDQLAQYGLTPVSRQAMLNMRNRYSRDIIPIEQAYTRRAEQIRQQANIMSQDPTHFFARSAATTSLDEYLDNPTLDTLTQNYSGALLTQQVSKAAEALAKDARNDPNVQTQLRRLLPYQYEAIRRTGFDPETVRQAILNSPDADKVLVGLVDNAMANSGMNEWNYTSPEERARVLKQARAYANQGLWSAVGQTQYSTVTDAYGMQAALQEQAQQAAERLARIKAGGDTGGALNYRMISNAKVKGDTTQLNSDLQFLRDVVQTGKYKDLSKEGKKVPSTGGHPLSMGYRAGYRERSEYDKALDRYKQIAQRYGVSVDEFGPNAARTLVNRIQRDIRTNVIKAQTYQMNMTDQSQLAQILEENSSTMFRGNREKSGFQEIMDDGTLGKSYNAAEAGEIFGKGHAHNFAYDPNLGFILSYRDKDNTHRTVAIDPELINFGTNDYSAGHAQVQQYLQAGDMDNAQDLIDEMMNSLYYRFNTQSVKQKQTGDIE